ncbi:MAG: LacI family DNA-binding transcriptional regulator [Phycisphaerae bacterium]|nr:LacI family DNA-binding transcriptional regulator [Phycisphaerae bacterium]
MAVTIKDVAKKASVSPSTVSMVINRRHINSRISKNTRQKVLDVIRESGYVPNLYARSIRNGSTFTIGIIVEDIDSPSRMIIKGAKLPASEKGYHVIASETNDKADEERFCIENFLSRRVDGIIIIPAASGETLGYLKELYSTGFPLVICGRPFVTEMDSVFDHLEGGSFRATSYCIEQGHTKIAYCAGNPEGMIYKLSVLPRYQGYLKALEENGIVQLPKNYYITTKTVDHAGGEEAAEAILKMAEKPTVIVFRNDEMAAGAIHYLRSKNIRVPDDISIVGYGNKSFAGILEVPLTTISPLKTEIGERAVRIILDKIENSKKNKGSEDTNRTVTSVGLMPELVIRDSVCLLK